MTKGRFRRRIWGWSVLLFIYGVTCVVAALNPEFFPELCGKLFGGCEFKWEQLADVLKALIPVVIAIPVADISAAFQRRNSYLQSLRDMWARLVPAVQAAVQYTHLDQPDQREYGRTLEALSIEIDLLRGLFGNIRSNLDSRGLYPYENLKEIHGAVSCLSFGKNFAKKKSAKDTRDDILKWWQGLRSAALREFDLDVPSEPLLLSGGFDEEQNPLSVRKRSFTRRPIQGRESTLKL